MTDQASSFEKDQSNDSQVGNNQSTEIMKVLMYLTSRLVDTSTTPMLFKTVQSKKIDPKKLITHRFKLNQIMDAYETFGNASKEKALKVIFTS